MMELYCSKVKFLPSSGHVPMSCKGVFRIVINGVLTYNNTADIRKVDRCIVNCIEDEYCRAGGINNGECYLTNKQDEELLFIKEVPDNTTDCITQNETDEERGEESSSAKEIGDHTIAFNVSGCKDHGFKVNGEFDYFIENEVDSFCTFWSPNSSLQTTASHHRISSTVYAVYDTQVGLMYNVKDDRNFHATSVRFGRCDKPRHCKLWSVTDGVKTISDHVVCPCQHGKVTLQLMVDTLHSKVMFYVNDNLIMEVKLDSTVSMVNGGIFVRSNKQQQGGIVSFTQPDITTEINIDA